MSIEAIKDQLPEFAKDIRLNLATVLTLEGAPELTQIQIDGIALASAFATRCKALSDALVAETQAQANAETIIAAKAAASIMAMNNVYYRFIHLVNDKEFSTLPARLRMNVIGKPGIPKIDFELMCLAVSAINGCGMCIEAHTQTLLKEGLAKTAIQSAVRIAAVIQAAGQALAIAY